MVSALAAVNGLGFLAFTLPRRMQEQGFASRIETVRVEAARQKEARATAEAEARLVRQNDADSRRLLDEVLPKEEVAISSTLAEVEKLLATPGLKVAARSFAREEEGPGVVRVNIRAPLEGGYRDLTALLLAVERSKAFLTVDSVGFREKKDTGPGGQVVLQIGISAWFRRVEGKTRAE